MRPHCRQPQPGFPLARRAGPGCPAAPTRRALLAARLPASGGWLPAAQALFFLSAQAMMLAYNDVFWMMGMCFVLCLPLLLLLGRRHQRPAPVAVKPATQPATAREVSSSIKSMA